MYRPMCAVIGLQALEHNARTLRAIAPGDPLLGVIKADGYGHGAVSVARTLHGLVDGFAVANLDEALVLREAGISGRIVLLEGVFATAEQQLAVDQRLDLVVHQDEQLALLESTPSAGLDVWLKIDTGMHRLGFAPEALEPTLARLRSSPTVASVRLMTHLACADDRRDDSTLAQLQLFEELVQGRSLEFSVANSAALLDWSQSRGGWARVGIAMYGVSPFAGGTGESLGLRPAMQLRTRLIAVKRVRRGAAIGYGGGWVCPEEMLLGVAAAGYGDGYPRHAPSGTPVLVNGRRASLVGRVSMDMITLDLRAHPDARPGDEVVLWGGDLPVEEVARAAGTIGYELLSGLTPRVPRVIER